MCESGAGRENSARRVVDSKPAMPPSGMNRRQSFMTLLKGAGAVAVGEAILTETLEVGAVRSAPIVAEEIATEGAAVLKNGRQVFHEMEKQIFGKIHFPK